jgi:hypothetical protein
MRAFAKTLIKREMRGSVSSNGETPAAFQASERLRPLLATMLGEGGYKALLSRALVLAGADIPWLRAVVVKSDGALEGLGELQTQLGRDEFFGGSVALLAQLLELLEAFIGPDLTSSVVGEFWPNPRFNKLVIENEDQNGKKRKADRLRTAQKSREKTG